MAVQRRAPKTSRKMTNATRDNPRTGAELTAALKAIEKKLGEHVVTRASDLRTAKRFPSGVFTFDVATCGGIPIQGMTEIHGIRSSGKTTFAYLVIAQAQMHYPDKVCVLVDQERSFDSVWAEKCGVDLARLEVITADTGEDAVDLMEGMVRVAEVCLVVLDSIGTLTPHKEIEGASEDQHVGIHAKLCTRLVRKLTTALGVEKSRGHEVSVLCINQQRAGVGKWAPPGQEAVSLPGGKALEHAFLIIARFKNKENMRKDSDGFDLLDYNEHAFTLEKNKICAGMRQGEYQLMRRDHDEIEDLREGMVDNVPTMIAYAKKMGVYAGAGRSWTLYLPDEEITLGSADEHIANIYGDPLLYWRFRNHLIALHAAKLRMPDYFIESFYGDDAPGIAFYESLETE
ncbi:putative RecA protein [Pseudomonas phage SM1]|uniref:DNA replication protein n=2 Tax=Samunavirus TaxID=2560221 RepID=A0AAU8L1H9_9CAUD|nr:putative RecA protein [Pseudomonas phage SM1]UGC97108.1 HNH endonuclease [Pseudomonas phage BHU-1]UGV19933.1 HNH endonuclease [Pseudomonas phage Pa BHU-15]UIW13627.1 HNH endonuclease [Pseudomonas phage Pa BHU-17]UVN14087.1 hypothetical protein FBPa45_0085 [Pseudomonas phage vB_PaeS_FBPa45]WDS62525.1 HNH endonuclease [Pseudomonas phage UF_RH6]